MKNEYIKSRALNETNKVGIDKTNEESLNSKQELFKHLFDK